MVCCFSLVTVGLESTTCLRDDLLIVADTLTNRVLDLSDSGAAVATTCVELTTEFGPCASTAAAFDFTLPARPSFSHAGVSTVEVGSQVQEPVGPVSHMERISNRCRQHHFLTSEPRLLDTEGEGIDDI